MPRPGLPLRTLLRLLEYERHIGSSRAEFGWKPYFEYRDIPEKVK